MRIGSQPYARFVAVALGLATVALGCTKATAIDHSKEEAPALSTAPLPSAPPSSSPTPAASSSSAEGEALPSGTAGLFERLAKEKSSRPTATPRADAVVAAFRKAGIGVVDESQVYAAMVKASYCESAKGTNVYISICEYSGEEEARAGRDFSKRTFASIPNREIFLNKKTTLTIGQTTPTPKGNAEAKSMADVFTKL